MTDSNPSESLMVGDRLQLDILPAQQIGMRGIWYAGNTRSHYADNHQHAIEHFNELIQRMECF